eukprot:m.25216 g.25216  ORF g.25216 m.25216 type:complete len:77 (+) comp28764_c0_seq1:1161-1391(+)
MEAILALESWSLKRTLSLVMLSLVMLACKLEAIMHASGTLPSTVITAFIKLIINLFVQRQHQSENLQCRPHGALGI